MCYVLLTLGQLRGVLLCDAWDKAKQHRAGYRSPDDDREAFSHSQASHRPATE